MKIKDKNKISRFPDRARDFLKKRKPLAGWGLRLGTVLIAVGLLFSVFRYGIHLKEAGVTTYFNTALKAAAGLDFSFVGNYAKGSLAELDEVAIDIKFKHLLRLQYLRERSLEEGFILPEFKNEEFPAKLTHNGKTVNIKIALTGLVAHSHLRNPSKWSFEAKVKGDDTFMGMKSFAMLLPSTRGYLTDYLGFELMKEKGLMGLRVDFVNVSINGKSKGIFYMEERFDKYLVENNRLREGIIFKIENGVEPYKESKLMEDPKTREQLLLIKRMYQQVMAGTLPPGKLFDLRKMAQVFVICDLMKNKHPLAGQNLRYYFNPVTGLAEPIAREWEELHDHDMEDRPLFLEKPQPATRHFRFERRPFIRLVYDNLEFKRYYVQEAAEACKVQFLDHLLKRNEEKLNALMKKVYRAWPYYDDPTWYLYDNQRYMRSVLFPEKEQLAAFFGRREGQTLSIYLQNLQDMPLQADFLSWKDSIRFYPVEPIALDSKAKMPKGEARAFSFRIPEGLNWDDAMAQELQAHYNLLGLEPAARSTAVQRWAGEDGLAWKGYGDRKKGNYDSFDFIRADAESGAITIPAGSWAISRDLHVPAGKNLVIAAGAEISLSAGARIISHSPVFCEGTAEQPIRIYSPDGAGSGLAVVEAPERSYLSHTTFDGISGAAAGSGQPAGALSFYRSAATINNCIFTNSKQGACFLSAFRSGLSIGQTLFSNISGNAVDADYCTGAISNSSIVNIGGDALNLRGADLNISYLYMNDIAGVGISAAEECELNARWLEVNNTATAIACSDGSAIRLADAQLRNSDVGIRAFREKNNFGPALVAAERIELQEAGTPFLAEPNCRITVDGKPRAANAEVQ
ncbi:MAG: CotH kinase family protein [Phaeodactylibacter sp.]|nr:CotH kinase family protein [Phaeodactylibacter sp.]